MFIKIFFKWAIPGLLSLFSFFQYTVDSKQMFYINKFLPMTGFEPRTSGIGSNRSTNWTTTTALIKVFWCHNSKSISSLGQKCHQILGQHHSCLLKLWRLSSLKSKALLSACFICSQFLFVLVPSLNEIIFVFFKQNLYILGVATFLVSPYVPTAAMLSYHQAYLTPAAMTRWVSYNCSEY